MRYKSSRFIALIAAFMLFELLGGRFAWGQAAPDESATDQRVAKLIQALGDDSLAARQKAELELITIGQAAKPLVTAAAESKNSEISLRSKLILLEVEKRLTKEQADELARRRAAVDLTGISSQTILDRIKEHAASEAWQEAGFEDKLIDAAIGRLVEQANAAGKELRVKFTPRFAECRPQRNELLLVKKNDLAGSDLLFVGKGSFYVGLAKRSIILVDGNVSLGKAQDCLIIARGAVTVNSGSGNVILAGQYLNFVQEGAGAQADGPGSLLMSGGDLRVSRALRSVFVAGGSLELIDCKDCILLNRGSDQIDAKHGVAVPDVKLLFVPKPRPNPLLGKLKIVQAAGDGSSPRSFATMDYNGVELVLRHGGEIKDNSGKPIPEFAGWKVELIHYAHVVFSNGKEDACFGLPYQ